MDADKKYCIHPMATVVPVAADRYVARLPLFGREVEGDPYLIRLLWIFVEDGKTVDEVLTAYPFRRVACATFLQKAIDAGVLITPGSELEPVERVVASPTFAHSPAFDAARPVPFTVLGVPWDQSTSARPGARFGPSAVRNASSMWRYAVDFTTLKPVGFADMAAGRPLLRGIALADAGDVYLPQGEAMTRGFDRTSEAVSRLLDAGTVPMVIGGDHAITHAVMAAIVARGEPLQILHVDAHTDLGDGLPGQALHHGSVFTEILNDYPDVEHIVQVGLRGIYDPSVLARPTDVVQIGMDLFRQQGVEAVVEALDPDLPIYVSVDIDAIDPAYAPSTGTPVFGGLRPDEVKTILRAAGKKADMLGFDIVEVSSESVDATACIAAELCLVFADSAVEGMRTRLLEEYEDVPLEENISHGEDEGEEDE